MKKLKHNHTLTDFLKFGIFAILLLMPILIFVPNAFYYGFNEHAVAQEKTEQIPIYFETNEVNTIDDLVIGNIYTLTYNSEQLGLSSNAIINTQERYIISETHTDAGTGSLMSNYPYIVVSSNNQVLYPYEITNNGVKRYVFTKCVIDFVYLTNTNVNTVINLISQCPRQHVKEYTDMTTNMSITDSMSYAWDSVWQNDLFSWTSNNGIYTVINNMNTTLGIPAQARLANYLTYITLFTVIYVIIDIIIGTFTMLTHLFNKEPK